MSLRRRMLAAASAVLLALPLAACTPATHAPTSTPTSAHTPLFASDDEALQAATDAYAAYLKMSDTISHDGGQNPERIKPYATDQALKLELKSAQQFRDAGAHSTGWTKYLGVRLQHQDGASRVSIYVCEDVSDVDVLNSSNISLVMPGRDALSAFVATLVNEVSTDRLKVENRETWSSDDICTR